MIEAGEEQMDIKREPTLRKQDIDNSKRIKGIIKMKTLMKKKNSTCRIMRERAKSMTMGRRKKWLRNKPTGWMSRNSRARTVKRGKRNETIS